MKKKFFYSFSILSLIIILFSSCGDKDKPEDSRQQIIFHFDYRVNGMEFQRDTLKYVNAAGNLYMVNEIQYFISDVTLHRSDGSSYVISAWKDMHYVDSDIPSTRTWEVYDNIPVGDYSSISFTFGINSEKNQSYMFSDPPERDMFWPDYLGGGYHYMKLNGKWLNPQGQLSPFDFHLGIGQVYASYPDSIISFIDNSFEVSLPNSNFQLKENAIKEFYLLMNIDKWFSDPLNFDFNYYGGSIMQNQEAMHVGCQNGWNVFSLK